jgi:hypothetical protein
VAKPQVLLAYHCSSGTPLIRIPEIRKLRHGSGILGSNAAFAARGFLSRMIFLDMYEPNFDKLRVILDVIIPAQARLKSNK